MIESFKGNDYRPARFPPAISCNQGALSVAATHIKLHPTVVSHKSAGNDAF
jgi:hypothetical protein